MYAFLCLKTVLEGCAGTYQWWLLWESSVLAWPRGEGHSFLCFIVLPCLNILQQNHFYISCVILNCEKETLQKTK